MLHYTQTVHSYSCAQAVADVTVLKEWCVMHYKAYCTRQTLVDPAALMSEASTA